MKNYTYFDEGLGSYMLTEEGKKLSERDMINIMGILEHRRDTDLVGFIAACEAGEKDFVTIDDILYPEENKPPVPPVIGWKLPL